MFRVERLFLNVLSPWLPESAASDGQSKRLQLDLNNLCLLKKKTLGVSLLSVPIQGSELGPSPQPSSLTSGGTYP